LAGAEGAEKPEWWLFLIAGFISRFIGASLLLPNQRDDRAADYVKIFFPP
jgi:hypothetical protein